jgi:hypothetical protein
MLQGTHIRETRDAAREIKFLVAPELAAQVLGWARTHLTPDPHGHGPAGDEYRIQSLYLDTDRLSVFHREGSYGRSKYRIRRYGSSDVAFLERKMRTSRLLSKRRTSVPVDQLARLQNWLADAAWDGDWFGRRLEVRRVAPVCQVSYRRHALVGFGQHGPMRLTFDEGIIAQANRAFGFDPEAGAPVAADHVIIEMKYCVDTPAVFRRLVEDFRLSAAPVSKYRLSMDVLRAAAIALPVATADAGTEAQHGGRTGFINA